MSPTNPPLGCVKERTRRVKRWADKLGTTGWTPQTSRRIATIFCELSCSPKIRHNEVMSMLTRILEGK